MAYTINKTDGNVLTTVSDGTINTTSSSLTLIGKNYAGYGEFQNENFVKLLENSASAIPPMSPLPGQLWYDKTSNLLKVFNGSVFKVVTGASASPTAPVGQVAGDLWYDSLNQQLKVFTGTSNLLVGPSYSATTGTSGAIVESITDGATGASHIIVKMFVDNNVVAIYSKDPTFTPTNPITGFTTIGPGVNLSSTISGAVFKGTATNADLLDTLNSTQFMRSDVDTSTTGTLTVDTDNGLYVGADDDLRLFVNGTTSYIRSQTNDGDLSVQVNDSGVNVTCMTFVGSTGNVSIPRSLTVDGNLSVTGTSNIKWADVVNKPDPVVTVTLTGDVTGTANTTLTDLASGTISIATTIAADSVTLGTDTTGNYVADITAGSYIVKSGSIGEGWAPTIAVNATTSNTANAVVARDGSGNFSAGTVYATATNALYADLAERFAADLTYVPGTVVMIGGDAEITQVNEVASNNVLGVISSNPAYLMNAEYGDNSMYPPVALAGRVPVRVTGVVNKGDRLVSAGNGVAKAALPWECTPFNVIGKALETKSTEDEGLVNSIVIVK